MQVALYQNAVLLIALCCQVASAMPVGDSTDTQKASQPKYWTTDELRHMVKWNVNLDAKEKPQDLTNIGKNAFGTAAEAHRDPSVPTPRTPVLPVHRTDPDTETRTAAKSEQVKSHFYRQPDLNAESRHKMRHAALQSKDATTSSGSGSSSSIFTRRASSASSAASSVQSADTGSVHFADGVKTSHPLHPQGNYAYNDYQKKVVERWHSEQKKSSNGLMSTLTKKFR